MCNRITKNPGRCSFCRSALRRIWWLGSYRGQLKVVVKEMKYARRRDFARDLGYRLSERLPFLLNDTVIVPVPTAADRIRMRGFDQSVFMARALAKSLGLPYSEIIERNNKVDLVGKSRRQRISLMADSFSLRGVHVPKNILLVDDVITTGATLESAARLLRDHGARHVDAAAAAH